VGAFGEKLRKQRELRGIELDAISNATKISTRMLRALEDERFDQLPGGVFNKGFVRAYARQIGLDEEESVAGYLAAVRENQLDLQSNMPDFRSPAAKPTPAAAPELRDHPLRDQALPDHVLPGHHLPANHPANNNDTGNDPADQLRTEDRRKQGRRSEDRRSEARRNEDRHPPNQKEDFSALPDAAPRAPAASPRGERFRQKYPAGDPAPADESSPPIPWGKLALALLFVTLFLAFWNFRRHAQPTAASPAVASSSQSPAPASPPHASAANQPPVSLATSPAGPASKPAPAEPQPDAEPSAPHPAARAAAPKPLSTFTLQIRADETTWVSLTADGKPVVANETLIAPAHTSVRATREIVVKTGNAAALSFLLNGQTIPAQANEGEVRTYVFDASGLQTSPQTQSSAPIDR
jgi:cytoskeletal protein RodZ